MYLHIYDKEELKNVVVHKDKFLKENKFIIYHDESNIYDKFSLCLAVFDDKETEEVFWVDFNTSKDSVDFIDELLKYINDTNGVYPAPFQKNSLVIKRFYTTTSNLTYL